MNRLSGIALGLLLVAGAIGAADPPPPEKTGLKVGEKAPEFKLRDQLNREHTLASLLKDNNVALVFFRSANW